MKKVFPVLFIVIFLFGCSLTQPQSDPVQPKEPDQPQVVEPTTMPTSILTSTQTPKPTITPEPESANLESVELGGIIYASFVLTYDPDVWKVIELDEFDDQLVRIDNPDCQVYSHLPRGLPGIELEVQTTQEKFGPYNFEVIKWIKKGGDLLTAVFNTLSDENISIQIVGSMDCFHAAWDVIEFSAEHNFSVIQ